MKKPKRINFEERVGDPSQPSDALVVLSKHDARHTGFLMDLELPSTVASLKKIQRLHTMTQQAPMLGDELKGYRTILRQVAGSHFVQAKQIVFLVETRSEERILLFLEYARQCHVATNPIASDMRHVRLK